MTPEQALEILNQAAAAANLPRVGHIQVQQAIQVLTEALKAKPAEVTNAELP